MTINVTTLSSKNSGSLGLGHLPLAVEPAEPVDLLRQAGVGASRADALHSHKLLPLELHVEVLYEGLPALRRLAVGEVGQDPPTLVRDVGEDNLPEADVSVAADLLDSPLVE